jgi:acetyl esterase/lipase
MASSKTATKELEVFLPPADKANGAAIVLCPGGGYIRHVTDREGYPIAQWLNEHGIACVILEYRLPEMRHQVPLLDAQRAIRLTRANAAANGRSIRSASASSASPREVTSPPPHSRISMRAMLPPPIPSSA